MHHDNTEVSARIALLDDLVDKINTLPQRHPNPTSDDELFILEEIREFMASAVYLISNHERVPH